MARNHRDKIGFSRRRRVYERDSWTCQDCRVCFAEAIPANPRHAPWISGVGYLQIDHIMPVSRGGGVRDETNLRALCEPCNQRKGARI